MLEELHVRDLALIEDAWLEFGPGMTALTGETGAGKTALIGALKLLLGERADSTLVRSGAGETVVEGRFVVSGTELVASRRVSAEGRSRCTLDGAMASVSLLADTLGTLVDLHGQHDHQALLAPATHVGYLDRYAGERAADARAAYRDARDRYREAVERRDVLTASLAAGARQTDYLRFVVADIAAVAPREGEDAELEARLPTLRHADRLALAAGEAVAALRGEGGGTDSLALAAAAISRCGGLDPALDEIAGRLEDVLAALDDVSVDMRRYGEAIDHDPAALSQVESRLAAIGDLKKKYGPSLDEVLETRAHAEAQLSALDDGGGGLPAAEEAVVFAEAAYRQAAEALVAVRKEAAPAFERALATAVAELAMGSARFEVAFADAPFESWTADGPGRVEFQYAAAPSEPARPLAKIASGGEVSRVMLALKGVLGSADSTPILVFDEIDAGIGGMTAHAVGRRLADLARTRQVVVVTHLAQVAAFADRHLVVSREERDGRAATSVGQVDGDARVLEIARMLSGEGSDRGVAHAEELIENAKATQAGAKPIGERS